MSENDIAVGGVRFEAIIVQRTHLLQGPVLGVAQIEYRAHALLAEVVGHLRFGVVLGFRVPGGALLGELLLRLQRITSPRAPMRMHVDELHAGIWPISGGPY